MKAEILKILKKKKIMYQDRNFVKAWEFQDCCMESHPAAGRTGLCDRGSAQQRLPPCGGSRCAYSGRASFGP